MFLGTSTDLISVGEMLIAGVGLVLAVPAWRLARAAVIANHTKAIAIAVAQYLGIPNPEDASKPMPAPNPDRPSIRDLLNDLLGESAAATAEIAIIRQVLEYHLEDGHGGRVPDYLFHPRRR